MAVIFVEHSQIFTDSQKQSKFLSPPKKEDGPGGDRGGGGSLLHTLNQSDHDNPIHRAPEGATRN